MAIVFPASPSNNDTFTVGSITYTFDGSKWIGLGVTPTDRLIEGNNNLQINASNNLVWTGGTTSLNNTSINDQLTIGSGSSANSEYGLIAYADSNTTSNKSSVYARNIGGGRNFTGDNSAGATTFEVYSSGSVVLTQSAATSINSLDTLNSGGGDNVVKVRTQANQGGDPYLKFDAGGSNFIVGEEYNGTTSNKLCLGTGENPSNVTGITINGLGQTVIGSYTQGSEQLRVKGAEADIWLDSQTSGIWRILGSTGGSTHRFRIYDNTNSRDVFNVHASGSVTKPRNPAFCVRNSTSSNAFSANSKATWDIVDINIGSFFDTTNHRFVCPVDGIYYFSCQMLSMNNQRLFTHLRRNEVAQSVKGSYTETYDPSTNTYQTATISMLLSCSATETISVWLGTQNGYGSNYANFSGYLVS